MTNNDQNILNEMHRKFSELAELQSELSQECQQIILNFHDEHFSIPHCIRWGEIGIDEIEKELILVPF